MDGGLSYRDAGVDLDAARRFTERIAGSVAGGVSGFAGTFALPPMRDPLLVACTDGVGTKLLLAQELLRKPKMSNHARGLWGYSGTTPAGDELTIQSTGMGGPSASIVLEELAGLGCAIAVRVGTCVRRCAHTRFASQGECVMKWWKAW